MWDVIDHYDHPMRSLMHSVWNPTGDARYAEPIILDTNRERIMQRARSAATPDMLPRFVRFTPEEKKDLYCFLMVGLTDLSLQDQFVTLGVLDEIDDCEPLIGYRAYDR